MSKNKTLIISYLPSGDASNTKKLLDHFSHEVKDTEIEIVDLLQTKIPDFTGASMGAYYTRNFMGKELNDGQKKSLYEMDRLAIQFKSADMIIMAFPMHNFSFPGVVKSYLDAVMQKGMVFDYTPTGFVGLMKGKKALALYTAAGAYEGDRSAWDMCGSLFQNEFKFMGFDEVKTVRAFYTGDSAKKDSTIKAAMDEITALIKKWY